MDEMMDDSECDVTYDDLDVESIVLHGAEEDEDVNPAEAGFLRGFLGTEEV